MHADAFYAIGQRHHVCQDHAAAGGDGRHAWALVSDGCSSAPDSDLGARLWTTAARQVGPSPARVLMRVAEMAQSLAVDPRCLDATLCQLRCDAAVIHAAVFGDGVVAALRHDGRIETWCVSHDDDAPAYLAYCLDPARKAAYLRRHGWRRIVHAVDGQAREQEEHHLAAAPYGFEMALAAADYRLVMLLSDGARSFRDARGAVPVDAVVARLCAVKTAPGRFVARRLRRFLRREAPALGWTHDDDLSVAAIWLGAT